MKLSLSFYQRQEVATIARELVGKVLIHTNNGKISAGRIVETEAYASWERGCHAFKGKTERNQAMFEKGGISYVYLCYGIHHLFNVVTNKKGSADAVLIRALQPLEGAELMMKRSDTKSIKRITSGPGKLTKAMGIDRAFNGESLIGKKIWIEDRGFTISLQDIQISKRIGIDYAGEDALLPWRFSIKGNEWVSK
jgi:DNA-3-methyladenine glycosylase